MIAKEDLLLLHCVEPFSSLLLFKPSKEEVLLSADSWCKRPEETILEIPSSTKTIVEAVLPHQTLHQLHVPVNSTNAAIDAWIPGIGAFQMAIGKKRDLDETTQDELAILGEGSNKVYWLLPKVCYDDSFIEKSSLEIHEYALLIPYP